MKEIQIFNYNSNEVRTVQHDGEPWFVLKDVCQVLGISHIKDTANRLDGDEVGQTEVIDRLGRNQTVTIINESGLYNVILRSDKPEAKPFRKWVTSEVLPSIRKTGVYVSPQVDSSMLFQIAEAMAKKEQQINALAAENEYQRQLLAEYEPKLQYLDTILQSTGTMVISQIAADYGMSARKLNKILHEEGIQHIVNGQWILYRKHMNKGYTKSKSFNFVHSDGRTDTRVNTTWTQKGRLLIHNILSARGIKASMDIEETA